jgi:hypothetical protein
MIDCHRMRAVQPAHRETHFAAAAALDIVCTLRAETLVLRDDNEYVECGRLGRSGPADPLLVIRAECRSTSALPAEEITL